MDCNSSEIDRSEPFSTNQCETSNMQHSQAPIWDVPKRAVWEHIKVLYKKKLSYVSIYEDGDLSFRLKGGVVNIFVCGTQLRDRFRINCL